MPLYLLFRFLDRCFVREEKKKFHRASLRSTFIFTLENTKNIKNAKNTTKNYVCEISKFSIHSCKLSLKKREKKLKILYTLN